MPIYKIQKRSGAIVDFNLAKVEDAILKAMIVTETTDKIAAFTVAREVYLKLETTFGDSIPTVEKIQDMVEEVLIEYGYAKVAKAYILYRAKREEAREEKNVVVEVDKTISEYLDRLDWRVNANANQGYSLGGMILNTAGKVVANYWLSHIYPREIGDVHRNADVHIHDLDMFSGYCAGWSLRALLEEGFNGVPEKIESDAPKHLSFFSQHTLQSLMKVGEVSKIGQADPEAGRLVRITGTNPFLRGPDLCGSLSRFFL